MRADLRSARAVCAVFAVLLTAAGCAAMPSDGPPERVDVPQGAGAENLQVRVFPVPPHKGEDPADLLAGFLDASNADEAKNYDTARKYLTSDADKRWNPEAGVVVLAATPKRDSAGRTADTTTITLSGTKVAELDEAHSYRVSADPAYRQTFTFVKQTEGPDKGEWRIDRLPDGLIVDQTNFKNAYRAVHRYFFAASDPSAEGAAASPAMVPDPIFLRRRTDPLTAAAKALAAGPSRWLAPAVHTAFDGVRIEGPVTVSDSGVASVRVDMPDFAGRQTACTQMAMQLYHTLADQQAKGQLDRLDLSGVRGGCSLTAAQAGEAAPGQLAGSAAGSQYYQVEGGQLFLAQGDTPGHPVPGPLGQAGQAKVREVAVRRDGGAAAAVSTDGRALYVAGLAEGDRLGDPVPTGSGGAGGTALTSPSWDGRQNLWLVDRDPAAPRVLMVRDRKALTAQVDGLGTRTVQSLRVSSDGTRVALVLKDTSGLSLQIGVVVHEGTPSSPRVRITGLRPLAPLLTDVASVSWADSDQLLVLGAEQDKLQLLHYIGTDGSQASDSPLQGGESMTAVSGTETRTGDTVPPVLAVSGDHRIFRLQGNQWREFVLQGHQAVSFAYPG
ncbi:LpqB family beta-propeller domain-containing protein [Kitasatospora sp. NPDC059571]|uniref:LpqB family beta-propeller domain-containing protein n=1 Tax=Kitasatospora sp. NPDC059571 TaxID=3346871 RepID=UPI0036B7CE5E